MKCVLLIFAGILSCAALSAQVRIQSALGGGYELLIDGQKTYITGVGGTFKLDVAAAWSNACRTWGGNIQQVERTIADARANNMYIMQGIGLTKDPKMYEDEAYKDQLRKQCRELAERFKDDRSIIMWGIGNEIELNGNSTQVAWEFVNELSELIKSIDKRHLTSTVITITREESQSGRKVCPFARFRWHQLLWRDHYSRTWLQNPTTKVPILVTEWGPTGWWECDKTAWGAPIERPAKRSVSAMRSATMSSPVIPPAWVPSYSFGGRKKSARRPGSACSPNRTLKDCRSADSRPLRSKGWRESGREGSPRRRPLSSHR